MNARAGWRTARSVASWVFMLVCLAFLAFAIWWATTGKTSAEVGILGYRPLLVDTASMAPDFEVNSFVLAHDDSFDQVKVGDVVVFRAAAIGGAPALHRVIAIERGQGGSPRAFTVKGDNNPHPDGTPVTRANYLGRVIAHTNLTAFVWEQAQGPYGWVRMIAIPVVVLVLLWMAVHFLLEGARPLTQALGGTAIACFLLVGVTAASALYLNKKQSYLITTLNRYATMFDKGSSAETLSIEQAKVDGTIGIPRIGVYCPVIDYVAAYSLTTAVTRFAGPGLNQPGNDVLVGHRAWGNLFFTRLDQLRPGDLIRITDPSRHAVTYAVTGHQEIGPDYTSVLAQPGDGKRHLTLIASGYDLQSGYVVTAVATGDDRAPAPEAAMVPGATSILPGQALPAAIVLAAAGGAEGVAWLVAEVVSYHRRRSAVQG